MKRIFTKFKSDQTGAMTLEFVIMLPVLMLWFAGMFVFFDAFHKWMKSLKATYTVSDMVTRQLEIDRPYLMALDSIFDKISQSRDTDKTWFRIIQVKQVNGTPVIEWQDNTSDPKAADFTIADISAELPTLVDNEHILYFESYRPFSPLFDWVGIDAVTFENNISASLRFTSSLEHTAYPQETPETDEGIDFEQPIDTSAN